MITISKVKNILGKDIESKTDEEIKKELDMAVFISEIILDSFKQSKIYAKVKNNQSPQ